MPSINLAKAIHASRHAPGGGDDLSGSFPACWKPFTVYTAGQQVVSPNNDVVSALAGFTSGAAYVPANWVLSGTYARVITPEFHGAVGDGVTDDTAALLAAIADALPTAAAILLQPGRKYVTNSPLIIAPTNTGTTNVPQPVPSIFTMTGAGHIGDELDASTTAIIAGPTFPLGKFLIDYQQVGTPYAGSGARVEGFTMECSGRAAGFRAQGPRQFRVSSLTIVNPAVPVTPGDNANGAFSIVAIAGGGSAGAYNVFDQITVWRAPADGFWDNTNFQNAYHACMSLALVTGGACYHTEGVNGTASNAGFFDCHYAGGSYAVQLGPTASPTFVGLTPYPGTPWPSKNAILIKNGWQYNVSYYYPPQFTNCRFINNPAAGVTAADGAIVRVQAFLTYQTNAVFTACYFSTATSGLMSHFAYSDAGIPGDAVVFRDAIFNGTPTVSPVNDQSGLFRFLNCKGVGDPSIAIAATTALTATALGRTHVCTATSAAYTLTLPTPVGAKDQRITVRISSSSTKLVTLATAAGNIDGLTTRIMWAGEAATLESDGTNWVKIAGKTIPMEARVGIVGAQTITSGAVTTILFDTMRYDNTGLMANAAALAANSVTVLRPGDYAVNAHASLSNPATVMTRFINLAQKNAVTTIVQQEQSGTLAFPNFAALNDVTLAAGDVIRAQVYQTCQTPQSMTVNVGATSDTAALAVREIPTW